MYIVSSLKNTSMYSYKLVATDSLQSNGRELQRWVSMLKRFIKETGLKDGCFVSCYYLPEENWPIEKSYTDR